MNFNCPCDELKFPPLLWISGGLSTLPRQIATFPEFRAAMLSAIGKHAPLRDWRARSSDDFGIMLLEMWSYVCDSISFYDEVIANESYLRTAQQRASLRKMVGLLGYIPRPAIAATVDLAILAEGRQPISVPAGTAFRSGAFPGSAPQVFELDANSTVHPFLNKWQVIPNRPATIDGGKNLATVTLSSVLLAPATVHLKTGQILVFEILGSPTAMQARVVKSITDYLASDGATYKKVDWDGPITVAGSTPLSQIELTVPTQIASLWAGTTSEYPIVNWGTGFLLLDALYRQLKSGSSIVIEKGGVFQWFKAFAVVDSRISLPPTGDTTIKTGSVTSTVTPPTIYVPITIVELDAFVNAAGHKLTSAPDFALTGFTDFIINYGFTSAGTVVAPAFPTLSPGDTLNLAAPFEMPQDGKSPNRFLLEDKNNLGDEITGGIDFTTGRLTLDQTSKISQPLTIPVDVFGNVVKASRGETVLAEILGSGDASAANQTFKLKKNPVTYTPSATAGNETGVASTLKVYVGGVRWAEVPTFYGAAPDAQVYIVRQNDDEESSITFGDGIRGSRLMTGSNNVLAMYRFGAGIASPPAGSIHQLGKPVKGIRSVRNPVPASGGDDAEPASGLRTYAPRSALLLGRAISVADMEAAAASVGGVRAVRAEWRWNQLRQRPLVQIWYIGAAGVALTVSQKLRGLSDPTTPIEVDQAQAVPASMSISIEIDPRYLEPDVLAAVRTALMDTESGLLCPELIGIGVPLFRSRIFDAVLDVPGTVAVTGLLLNGVAFDPYGISPGAGKYFDFENGTLLLNGKTGVDS
ncbi:MAG TPA: hypothetical protein VK582_09390 [Pyrinomonadaceae bacterium]|nr:hypothetical protein [Pyrinomonadaceae bacterium]